MILSEKEIKLIESGAAFCPNVPVALEKEMIRGRRIQNQIVND